MAKAPEFDWYLTDWMDTVEMTQADLSRATDYPKAKMSELVNGVTRYNRDVVNALSKAMNIAPYELLMPPELANAFKQFRASAKQLTTLAPEPEPPTPIYSDATQKKRDQRAAASKKPLGRTGAKGTGTKG